MFFSDSLNVVEPLGNVVRGGIFSSSLTPGQCILMITKTKQKIVHTKKMSLPFKEKFLFKNHKCQTERNDNQFVIEQNINCNFLVILSLSKGRGCPWASGRFKIEFWVYKRIRFFYELYLRSFLFIMKLTFFLSFK